MDQGSEAWFNARIGKITASRIADVMAKTKSGYSASRANYMAQLIAERLTGQREESYTNAAMLHGTQTEPLARAAYEIKNDIFVIETGFVDHPTIVHSGASPDGLVGDDGLIEIKCPNTATHLDTLISKEIPSKYVLQMQWQLDCTGRDWCDFVSFDPRLPDRHQLFIKRVEKDDEFLKEIRSEVTAFLEELDEKLKKLEAL